MPNNKAIFLAALTTVALAGCSATSPDTGAAGGGNPAGTAKLACPSARLVASNADLVSGPLARGRLNDFVLENTELRAIVQKGGRNWFSVAPFGGNIIDAVPKNDDGTITAKDHFEEATLGTNIESAPNFQTVEVIEAGGDDGNGNCQRAVIRASGPDDLLDFVNASSIIRDLGFQFPASADDVDLKATIETDYILEPGNKYVTMHSRLISEDPDNAQAIYMVEYLSGSGEVELFQYGYGFGEPLIANPCGSCKGAIYAGHEGGLGVSYGILNNIPGSSSLATSGVGVLLYGADAVGVALGTQAPPFSIPAGGTYEITRYFAVGDGSVSSVLDIQHQILGTVTGELSGTVTDANGPVANAEIAVITAVSDFAPLIVVPRGPTTIVANHFRTDANGQYAGTLPEGNYELRINVPNRLAPTPSISNVSIAAATPVVQDFVAPLPARIRVLVNDQDNALIAAKVQLLGNDISPDAGEPLNNESTAGLLDTVTGVFGDALADPLSQGVVFAEFAINDPNHSGAVSIGDTGVFEIEPGTYTLSVSRGPRYSHHSESITLAAGELTTVNARVVQVVDTAGVVFGDFHVHSFNSPDSEVTDRERVATYLAEDMDFFTPSDHGRRSDFEPIIANMQVTGLVASAPSAEMTTFDYGHINAWPVAIDNGPASDDEPSQSSDPKISLGAVDWGNPAPAGLDFPSAGHFARHPAEIFTEAKADPLTNGREVVVQLNHLETHFGAGGLEIDTGMMPPQSHVDTSSRRFSTSHDPSLNLFDESLNFDTLELWIGVDGRPHSAGPEGAEPGHLFSENLGDWFNMINQGITKTFVANSDTHERRLTSMSSRNWIYADSGFYQPSGAPDIGALRTDPHGLGDAVRAGRSVASNSLFMEVDIRTVGNGAEGGLSQNYSNGTPNAPLEGSGDVEVNISINSPVWAEYDLIEVFMNTHTVRHASPLGIADSPARYNYCSPAATLDLSNSDFTRQEVVTNTVAGTDYSQFATHTSVTLTPPANEDYWIVVMARGREGISESLYPIVPNDYDAATDLGVNALAISNPIYVSQDGNNAWDAPASASGAGISDMAHSGAILPPDGCP